MPPSSIVLEILGTGIQSIVFKQINSSYLSIILD